MKLEELREIVGNILKDIEKYRVDLAFSQTDDGKCQDELAGSISTLIEIEGNYDRKVMIEIAEELKKWTHGDLKEAIDYNLDYWRNEKIYRGEVEDLDERLQYLERAQSMIDRAISYIYDAIQDTELENNIEANLIEPLYNIVGSGNQYNSNDLNIEKVKDMLHDLDCF